MGNTQTKAAQSGLSTALETKQQETKTQDQKQTIAQIITQEAKDQLKTACKEGKIEEIEELIAQYSANILKEKLSIYGDNALILAAAGGQNNTTDHLLTKYPDQVSLSDTNNNGDNALLIAACYGNISAVKKIIDDNCSVGKLV